MEADRTPKGGGAPHRGGEVDFPFRSALIEEVF